MIGETTARGEPAERGPRGAGAGTLKELCASFVDGYRRRDPALLLGLYLDSARIVPAWNETHPVSPAEDIEDRMRLGLPMQFRVQDIFEDGARAHVRLAWSVEGTTTDGTDLEISGTASLECEKRDRRWYIASEWLRHEAPGLEG
ncbi:hypothetical protein [Sinomonas sp. P10A9]|uniref:Ketosteroid isomerase-like protein n=1 Tax=Sinomonas puerhi TaxID=3238584 RepID=A0AB39L0C6_9MICC